MHENNYTYFMDLLKRVRGGLWAAAVVFVTVPLIAPAQSRSPSLIEVASFGHYRPIGVTVAPEDNRLFVSFPRGNPYRYALVEIVDGKASPFPDPEWNRSTFPGDKTHFDNVHDLSTDDRNHLWVLDSDHGNPDYFKLVEIDLATDSVRRVYGFADLPRASALNDVNVDTRHGLAYLSDPGLKALVVLNLRTGRSRVVLRGDSSMRAAPGFVLHLDGVDVVNQAGTPFVSNVNGIALSADHRYLYYRAINQLYLYRIQTRYLADTTLTDREMSRHVERVARVGVSHGMIADAHGNVYLSDSPDQAIRYWSPDGRLHTLVTDRRIIWPDSFGIGSDGFLYFSCSQINRSPGFNHGTDKTDYPYRVYKVRLPSP